jgi:membrane-bound ClpP family serine protease
MNVPQATASRFGWAWLALALALAVHVTDEALTGFLSVYNPAVRTIRAHVPFLPLPVFTFGVWLAGLAAGICLLLALSAPAFRGVRWLALVAYPLGILMFMNGLGHVAGSVYMRRLMPGVYSAPLLLVTSPYLLLMARRLRASRDPRAERARAAD